MDQKQETKLTIETPTPNALDAASFIFTRLRKIGPVEAMKLHMCLYYANAWSLADRGRPLFADEIQARTHGQVVASLHPCSKAPAVSWNGRTVP